MTVRINKSAFNIREKLSELERPIGVKGNELMRAETAQDARDFISAGRKNMIINGDFRINQRGGSNTTINTYALDRWRSYGGPMGFTISQQDVLSSLETSRYALRFQRTSGNTQTNNTGIVQGIESKNCEGLAGTQLTLSFKARRGADLSDDLDARLFYGTGTDDNPVSMTGMTNDGGTHFTLTTSFASYTKTVTVPAGITQISLAFAVTPSGTAGANDWFEVTEVQLEVGKNSTEFEHRSYGEELALCQRYFYTLNNGTGTYRWFHPIATSGPNYRRCPIEFPVTMRANPVVTNIVAHMGGVAVSAGTQHIDLDHVDFTYTSTNTEHYGEVRSADFDAEL